MKVLMPGSRSKINREVEKAFYSLLVHGDTMNPMWRILKYFTATAEGKSRR